MATIDQLVIELTANSSQLQSEVRAMRATIETELGKATKSTDQLSSKLDGVSKSVQGVGKSFDLLKAAVVGIGIEKFTHDVVEATVAAQQIHFSLLAGTGSAEKAAAAYDFVRATAVHLGLDLRQAAADFGQLTAATRGSALEGQKTNDIFTALAQTGTVLHWSSQQMGSAMLAVQQIVSKGRVQSQELTLQLGQVIPGAMAKAAHSMGMGTAEFQNLVEKGVVPATEFLPRFAQELKNAFGPEVQEASESANAKINRFKTTVFELQTKFGSSGFVSGITDGLGKISELMSDPDFQAGLTHFGKVIGDTLALIAAHSDDVVKLAKVLGGLKVGSSIGSAFGPVGTAVGGLGGAILGGAAGNSTEAYERDQLKQLQAIKNPNPGVLANIAALQAKYPASRTGVRGGKPFSSGTGGGQAASPDLDLTAPFTPATSPQAMQEFQKSLTDAREQNTILKETLVHHKDIGEEMKFESDSVQKLSRALLPEEKAQIQAIFAERQKLNKEIALQATAEDLDKQIMMQGLRNTGQEAFVAMREKELELAKQFGPLTAEETKNLEAKYDALRKATAAGAIGDVNRSSDQSERELAALKEGVNAHTKMVADIQAENAARSLGIDLESQQGQLLKEAYEHQSAVNKTLDDALQRQQDLKTAASDFADVIGGAFEDAVINGEKFTDILDSVLKDIEKIALRVLVTKPFETALTGALTGEGGGGTDGGGLASLFGGVLGKAFGGGSGAALDTSTLGSSIAALPGKAAGGPVFSDQPVMVGEHGPELFTPGRSGNITPNHQMGGGATVINFNLPRGMDAREARVASGAIAARVSRDLMKAQGRFA